MPDIVVFYDGYNDTASAFFNGSAGVTFDEPRRAGEFNLLNPHAPGRRTALYKDGLLEFTLYSGLGQVAKEAVAGIAPSTYSDIRGELVRSDMAKAATIGPAAERKLERQVADLYLANVGFVRDAGQRLGFKSLFFWQPALVIKPRRSPYEAEQERAAYPGWKDFFLGVYGLMGKEAAENRVNDISHVFENHPEPFFIDDVHISESGNRIVAQAMMPEIMAAIGSLKNSRTPRIEGSSESESVRIKPRFDIVNR